MKKIVVIDSNWVTGSPMLRYVIQASKGNDTEVCGVFLSAGGAANGAGNVKETLNAVREELASEGIGFTSVVVDPDAKDFLSKLESLKPASLVLTGSIRFSEKMKKNGVSFESLKKVMNCPVTTAEAFSSMEKKAHRSKRSGLGKWLMYAAGSAIIYTVLFPNVKMLNEKLFMTGTVLGALATMAVVVLHAWIWGNTTHILPKLFKLEK
ncbi:MAG: hypothetical protein AB1499_15380 [Nitrospirota bacterium]